MGVMGSAIPGGSQVLMAIGAAVAAILMAALSRLVADDLKAWLPRWTEVFTARAIAMLPEKQRERYGEEWRSHLQEVPGELSKLATSLGLLWAASSIMIRNWCLKRLISSTMVTDCLIFAGSVSERSYKVDRLANKAKKLNLVADTDERLGRLEELNHRIARIRDACTPNRDVAINRAVLISRMSWANVPMDNVLSLANTTKHMRDAALAAKTTNIGSASGVTAKVWWDFAKVALLGRTIRCS